MTLDLLAEGNVQQGLKELVDSAYSMSDNLKARVETHILEDGTDLFDNWLDSKTLNLYGSKNKDKKYQFKIDNEFDLNNIIDKSIIVMVQFL